MKTIYLITLCLAALLPLTRAQAAIEFLPGRVPDFAAVERAKPLSQADRGTITVQWLKQLNQEQLDQLYARLGSGPIPTGPFHGTILVRNEQVIAAEQKVMEIAMGQGFFSGMIGNLVKFGMCSKRDTVECLGEFLWKGKRFYPRNDSGQVELRNAISTKLKNNLLLASLKLGYIEPALQRAKQEDFFGAPHLMLFPANVFCGQSLVDARKESIIIDYAFGDDFQPYFPELDGIAGRNGKWVRDEIRMVRPGLYLGRAYIEKLFVLNFVLEGEPSSAGWGNSCWAGMSWN